MNEFFFFFFFSEHVAARPVEPQVYDHDMKEIERPEHTTSEDGIWGFVKSSVEILKQTAQYVSSFFYFW